MLEKLTDDEKRQELGSLREYIGKPIAKTDCLYFLDVGHEMSSGPIESFSGCLTND